MKSKMVEAENQDGGGGGFSDSDSEEKVELTKEELEDMMISAVKNNNL